ncbi:MAG: hypothetical protein HWQ35_31580 [Nostoc sp. NMS1]|uniref:hypothetical protein n=1 Tax=unclassified Nostoc TaxID=2593658 RepID=UPI0025EC176A|nr:MULTISPECIES: hypothetical protein [unclassified Nostoc]MBN3910917.1 hypothetical protein [Nostoc sp. NMS1]MBN3993058.1 hypothetical protein [Nostoc sp. NMS2]
MKVIDHKDANNQSFVLTAIYRVSSLNRTVLSGQGTDLDPMVEKMGQRFARKNRKVKSQQVSPEKIIHQLHC